MRKMFKIRNVVLLSSMTAMLAFTAGCDESKSEINPMDFVKAEVTGFDGHASVSFSLDSEKIADKIEKTRKDDSVIEAALLSDLLYSLEINYEDDAEDHKNGDKIALEFSWEKAHEEDSKYEFSGKKGTYTLKDLDGGEEVDPFADLVVTFSGTAPYGVAEINDDACDTLLTYNGYYSIDGDNYSLSNGDTITIEYVCYSEDNLYDEKKYLGETTKEYTVEGLSEKVETLTLDQMSNYNTEILNEVQSKINEWDKYDWSSAGLIENTWYEYSFTGQPQFYKGYYAAGDPEDTYSDSLYFAVYKIDAVATVTDNYNDEEVKNGKKFNKTIYYIAGTQEVLETDGQIIIEKYEDWWSGDTGYIYYSNNTTEENEIEQIIKDYTGEEITAVN